MCPSFDTNITKHKTLFANHAGVKIARSTCILPKNENTLFSLRFSGVVAGMEDAKHLKIRTAFVCVDRDDYLFNAGVCQNVFAYARFFFCTFFTSLLTPVEKIRFYKTFVPRNTVIVGVFAMEQQYYDFRSQWIVREWSRDVKVRCRISFFIVYTYLYQL